MDGQGMIFGDRSLVRRISRTLWVWVLRIDLLAWSYWVFWCHSNRAVLQVHLVDLTWNMSIITGVELSFLSWNFVTISDQVIPTVKVGLQLRISLGKVNGLPRLPLRLKFIKGAVLGIINKPY